MGLSVSAVPRDPFPQSPLVYVGIYTGPDSEHRTHRGDVMIPRDNVDEFVAMIETIG